MNRSPHRPGAGIRSVPASLSFAARRPRFHGVRALDRLRQERPAPEVARVSIERRESTTAGHRQRSCSSVGGLPHIARHPASDVHDASAKSGRGLRGIRGEPSLDCGKARQRLRLATLQSRQRAQRPHRRDDRQEREEDRGGHETEAGTVEECRSHGALSGMAPAGDAEVCGTLRTVSSDRASRASTSCCRLDRTFRTMPISGQMYQCTVSGVAPFSR